MSETVSVVIPYYNGSRFIKDALASVRAQTHAPDEVVIIDDGSRPDEAAALDQVAAAEPRHTRVIHLPRNRGVSVARNVGIKEATGTFIAFLDCDDLWMPDKLEKQMRFLDQHRDYLAVHAGLKSVYEDGREVVDHKTEVRFDDLVHFPCPILPSAVVMQRQALFECGLFDPTMRVCQDIALFLRFTSQFPIGCVDEPLVIRRVQSDGLSRNIPVFHHEADRVYRDFRYAFKDEAASVDTLFELHADFMLRAFYARDARFFWKVFRRATRADVTPLRLLWRVVKGLWHNRRNRHGRGKRR